MKKILFILFVMVILGVATFFYIAFFGLPWKKITTAKELEAYVEKKYAIEVSLQENYYNFKNGSYESIFVLDENPAVSFAAAKVNSGNVLDYYPEAVWVEEAEKDVYPVLKKSFPSFSMESYSISPVYGVGNDLEIGENVPSYKDVETGIGLAVHFNEIWTEENEKLLVKEAYDFITSLQKQGVKNFGIFLYIDEKEAEEEKRKTFYISIESGDFLKIQSEEDVKKYTIF